MKIKIGNLQEFKQKACRWASTFDSCCYLDSNSFDDQYSKFDSLIAVGVKDELIGCIGNAFKQLETFRQIHPDWLFGFFSYDLKNEVEHLCSENADYLEFPDLYFFVPHHLIVIKNGEATIISNHPDEVYRSITNQPAPSGHAAINVNIRSRFNKAEYISAVNHIKTHITLGDIYVTNFCQEFFAEDTRIDPLEVFFKLTHISPAPFAGFFKVYDSYILSASPERFLAKRGNKLISQPIKGTSARYMDPSADEESRKKLKSHPKELQENVMIVDLVRNDLTRSARPGTVNAEELFSIYSFAQVHQMLSTVTCEIRSDISLVQAIKNTFPMGSMTGAPKISSMKLMEQFERSKRGLYSGALGYFDPEDDFDFNVVIRTILYNAQNLYLSIQAGSAITVDAEPEREYEECLLKINGLLQALNANQKLPS